MFKRRNQLLKIVMVLPTIFIALILMFSVAPHAHAAFGITIEPIYQVLTPRADCGSYIKSLGAGSTAAECFKDASGHDTMGSIVATVWYDIMAVVNSLVLAMLIWVAFMNILRIQLDSYAVKKILPTFIMAVILANFSFLIARMLIDVANIAISVFLTGNSTGTVTGAFGGVITTSPIAPADAAKNGITNYSSYISIYILKQLIAGVAAVLVAILAFIFLIRNYFIYFLICIAPAAFMAMILPLTKKYFQQWWSQFLKWIFMPVISVFWLWLAGEFIGAVSAGGTWVLPFAFGGLCLYMAITTPFKVDKAVGTWGGYGKKIWGKTGGAAWKSTGGAGVNLARTNATAWYNREKESAKERWYSTKVGQNQRRRQEAFKLRNEIPGMVRENLTGKARKANAFDFIYNPRTQPIVRERLRALIRKEVSGNISNDSRLIKGDVDIIKGMIQGENRTDPNTGQTYYHIFNPMDPKEADKFKDADAKLDHLAALQRIEQIEKGSRAPQGERQKATAFLTNTRMNKVSSKDLKVTETSNVRELDSSGLNSSAMPMTTTQTIAGQQSAQNSGPGGRESLGDIRRRQAVENQSQQSNTASAVAAGAASDLSGLEDLLRHGTNTNIANTDQLAAALSKAMLEAQKKNPAANLGAGTLNLPELRVRLTGIDPAIHEPLLRLLNRAGGKSVKLQEKLVDEIDQTKRAVGNLERKTPEELIGQSDQGLREVSNLASETPAVEPSALQTPPAGPTIERTNE